VIEEEAGREEREVRAAAEGEAARLVEEARAGAAVAREAVLARARADAERAVREAEERHALARDRALLVERRQLLDGLRVEIAVALRAASTPALDAALLAEVLPEVGEGPLEVIVDPGAEEAARRALAALDAVAAARATVRAAPERRGGVVVIAGRRVLDDSLPARLARIWPDLEPELAGLLEAEPRASSAPRGEAGEEEAA
jgi:V/A-type H+-transporting ATPase subunit E